MSKLYIFGIGGTGSRVLRSLTMLLASGVEIGTDEIVPIIIDPDSANADLTRTVMLLNDYNTIKANLNFTDKKNKFFQTKITREMLNYTLPVYNTNNQKFRSFIGLSEMSKENKAMMKMLFSDKNLDADMNVGFKGNPNIGSVVLNQIVQTREFSDFANSFQQEDKIIIVSSIFGGTGASGFPLLLKTLRKDSTMPNHAIINNAEIGAITLLPYFKLKKDDDSEIDSSTFISKAKSALAYYERNVAVDGQVNALYFLGDKNMGTYDNHDGGPDQKNDAHLMEFLSAVAIVDFGNNHYGNGISINKEFSVDSVTGALTFSSFDDSTNNMLRCPLTQFALTANCLINEFGFLEGQELVHCFSNNFLKSQYMSQVKKYMQSFLDWLKELQKNNRSLGFFNLECGGKPFNIVNGATVYKWKGLGTMGKYDYDLFVSRLNNTKGELKGNDESNLMEMFYIATQELCENKFKF